ncbi:MAG: hypothetical protein JWM56_858 [Candidatus Peribacteria bacterium]|nr:hypothetical protein [Candidatus Peribacteria bacterium]
MTQYVSFYHVLLVTCYMSRLYLPAFPCIIHAMQLRFTTVLGTAVVDETTQEELGVLSGILIHPDTGKIEGFFVAVKSFFHSEYLFLSVLDIRSWGLRVQVANHNALSPFEDRVRLQPLLEDQRTILGQRIRTESGVNMGRCKDIQFDTRFFQIEWLFPKKWGRWRIPFPLGEIIEVRRDAIIIKDQKPVKAGTEPVEQPAMLKMPDIA